MTRNCTGDVDGRTGTELIVAGLALRSIGYRGCEIDRLPWDAVAGIVPNVAGRVIGNNRTPLPGAYVTGWIKRGPHGVIGTNRTCAQESVAALLADFDDGLLDRAVGSRQDILRVLADRGARPVPRAGWRAIDAAERHRDAAEARPRVKLVEISSMLTAAGGAAKPQETAASSLTGNT